MNYPPSIFPAMPNPIPSIMLSIIVDANHEDIQATGTPTARSNNRNCLSAATIPICGPLSVKGFMMNSRVHPDNKSIDTSGTPANSRWLRPEFPAQRNPILPSVIEAADPTTHCPVRASTPRYVPDPNSLLPVVLHSKHHLDFPRHSTMSHRTLCATTHRRSVHRINRVCLRPNSRPWEVR